jgi:hypothetical protein
MSTDHATRQLRSNIKKNEYWHYQDRAKKGFSISRDELKELTDNFKKEKKWILQG